MKLLKLYILFVTITEYYRVKHGGGSIVIEMVFLSMGWENPISKWMIEDQQK